MDTSDVQRMVKALMLKDLRVQCRARGLSPAGGKEQLTERLTEDMMATSDFNLKNEAGENVAPQGGDAGVSTEDMVAGQLKNNYGRPNGQNVGNFLTDRPSSRVLAAPGGASSIVFGSSENITPAYGGRAPGSLKPGAMAGSVSDSNTNNYARPGGQNVGNFLTDRHAVKIQAPPGGASQIQFG